jgi:hypothetical protein
VKASDKLRELTLGACGCVFVLRCADDEPAALIKSVFSGLVLQPSQFLEPTGQYQIEQNAPAGSFRVSNGVDSVSLEDTDSLLFYLDKEITLALQRARPDLFFLHAAALAWNNGVIVVAGVSGVGKSTLTLMSLGQGLEYLSDELAPIDLRQLTVEPYPHALCLKSPPSDCSLPPGTLRCGGRFHVPIEMLPSPTHREPLPLSAFIFLQRDEERFHGIRSITRATGVARLMAQALNSLAHPDAGLDAAIELSQAIPCFELDAFDLRAGSQAMKTLLQGGLCTSSTGTGQPWACR